MTLLLGILAGVWALFLIPPYVRNRSERSADSISSFHRHLSTLERTRPNARHLTSVAVAASPNLHAVAIPSPAIPVGRGEARRRRREVLFTLIGAVAITMLLAFLLGGIVILCNLLADALLIGYLYLLVQLRKTEAEREIKVQYRPTAPESADPALLWSRVASR